MLQPAAHFRKGPRACTACEEADEGAIVHPMCDVDDAFIKQVMVEAARACAGLVAIVSKSLYGD